MVIKKLGNNSRQRDEYLLLGEIVFLQGISSFREGTVIKK